MAGGSGTSPHLDVACGRRLGVSIIHLTPHHEGIPPDMSTCPQCGYCPECGRFAPQPSYPSYPPYWQIQPWVNYPTTVPVTRTYTTDGTGS
jgi:hypothetical protein